MKALEIKEKKIKRIKPMFFSKSNRIINLKHIDSPLGTLVACANDKGVCFLQFLDKEFLLEGQQKICSYLDANLGDASNPHFDTLEHQLSEYFEGKRTNFSVPLVFVGTDFQKQVWQSLMNISYGKTMTYQEQANAIEKPTAVRAVANANGKNPLLILVPCHRVIGSNGKLSGYSCGIDRKKSLLKLENPILEIE